MAGTATSTIKSYTMPNSGRSIQMVRIDWVADAANGSVPTVTIPALYGYVVKTVTKPGGTAPTNNYTINFQDQEDTAVDALGGTMTNNRSATVTQVAFPLPGALFCGQYVFSLSGNSVNSATGYVMIFVDAQ